MKRYPDTMPYAWLAAKLNQLQLDVFIHNFSLKYPFQEQQVNKKINNLVTIMNNVILSKIKLKFTIVILLVHRAKYIWNYKSSKSS